MGVNIINIRFVDNKCCLKYPNQGSSIRASFPRINSIDIVFEFF